MDKGTIIRTILLAYALVNQSLVLAGYSPLPFADHDMEVFLSGLLTVGASIWAWWKNNDITRRARANKALLKREGLK
jgi:SPP1 family holin